MQDLYIHNYNQDTIKVSNKISVKMDHLRCNPVSIRQPVYYPDVHNCSHKLNIALLNIQSLKQDPFINGADIICLTETWLKQDDTVPCLKPYHKQIRCDRSYNSLMHGGVLLSHDVVFDSTVSSSYSNNGLEILAIVLHIA